MAQALRCSSTSSTGVLILKPYLLESAGSLLRRHALAAPRVSKFVTCKAVDDERGSRKNHRKRPGQSRSAVGYEGMVRTSVQEGSLKIGHGLGSVWDRVLEEKREDESLVEIKATVVVCKKDFFVTPVAVPAGVFTVCDQEDEELGKKVFLQLISGEADPSTGKALRSTEMTIENWTEADSTTRYNLASTNLSTFEVSFKVKKCFGAPGAIVVRNFHRNEFLLKAVTIELPGQEAVHFPCDSCIFNAESYTSDRTFFSNKVYLPHETPVGLKELREQELVNLRGDGTGERKLADRIYDYEVYNDLGDCDQHESLKRPVLGGNDELPYPRRLRTGRQPSTTQPEAESRGDLWTPFYIPRDERLTMVRTEDIQECAIQAASRKLMPALQNLYSTQLEFESMNDIADLFKKGVVVSAVSESDDSESDSEHPAPETESVLRYPMPKVIAVDEKAWTLDDEFAREMLAGLNPVVIERLQEFPMRSKLDAASYGINPVSGISAQHIEPFLDGMDAQTVVAQSRLFALDYHDAYLPFVNKINESPTCKAYATRTILFLTKEGTLRPVAIELSLPAQETGGESSNRIVTPPPTGTKHWVWELAKAHVLANDAGYHQLVSHWLRSHATMEPVVIATNRQLSALHPVHQALVPHFRNTLDINAAARKALINAGGIIEKTFTPHEYSMQMSSAVYKHGWRFDEQALPNDLIKRGMAIPDENSEHGVRLVIEDYPFAADGLELWGAIRSWLLEYVDLIYADEESVQNDRELQSWWAEIRTVGHGDKKDADGWPTVDSKAPLVQTLSTIVWIASCHHAAVNFGQYEYAGFMPNHPTMTRRLIPAEGTPAFEELQRNPEAFYLSTISNETQATVIMTTTEALSTHSSQEEYLGQRSTPNWTSDEKILAVFEKFQERIGEIEELIKARNQEKRLKNRYGSVAIPYELLYPSSDSGLTGKGVPNSTSI